MGTVKVTIAVGDPQGRRFEDLEVTVDTGSTYTAVPREMLQRLGVTVERSLPSKTRPTGDSYPLTSAGRP